MLSRSHRKLSSCPERRSEKDEAKTSTDEDKQEHGVDAGRGDNEEHVQCGNTDGEESCKKIKLAVDWIDHGWG